MIKQKGGGAMAKKQKRSEQKQRRDDLTRIRNLAAALYWFVKLCLEVWDRFHN